MSSDFDYDIAFSFHSKDEALATQLNDLLQDRFKTFLYSKRQEELAGTDGEVTFNAAFGSKARLVVVFYRSEWGQTPFTRVEETAIRNRAFDNGYDFTIFIPTEVPPASPKWLPKTRLWFGLERFGLQGAAGAIEARVQELGGSPRDESVADRAARLKRARELAAAQKQFRESEEGVRSAREAYDQLWISIEHRVAELEQTIPLRVRRLDAEDRLLLGAGIVLYTHWQVFFGNSLDGAELTVSFLDRVPRLPQFMSVEEPRTLRKLKYEYVLVRDGQSAYISKIGTNGEFSSEKLADELLKAYLDEADALRKR